MKALFFFAIGVAAGAYGYYYLQEKQPASRAPTSATAEPTTPVATNPSLRERASNDAHAAKQAISDKLAAWHLTPEEIRSDLERTGRVVRTKAHEVGSEISGKTANARIVTLIKGKYALDSELSARSIEVTCDSGVVTLQGNVANPALIAKAVGIALDTEGVTKVDARLSVSQNSP